MSPWIFAALATYVVLQFGVPVAIALLMLLVPGRKGTMRDERELTLAATDLPAARAEMIERLRRDGFVVETAAADAIVATRPGAPVGHVHTHADKTARADVRLRADGAATRVTIAVWLADFIFYDTGESRVVDRQLARLVDGPSAREPEPVPNASFSALAALIAGGAGLSVLAFLATGAPTPSRLGILAGVALAAFCCFVLALNALRVIRARPAELTGRSLAIAAMLLAVLSLSTCAALGATRYRGEIRQATTQAADGDRSSDP